MIVGFNHNILYQGVGFHVQTEDGGLKSPSLVTLLYHGGIIVSSQKTSYADILGANDLNQVVEDLAKEQHKGMLRRLTKGEFDQRIRELGIEIEGSSAAPEVKEESAPQDSAPAEEPVETIEPLPLAAEPERGSAAGEDSWLSEEVEELEPIPLELGVGRTTDDNETVEFEEEPAAETLASAVNDLPQAIEPAYEPPSAEDRGTQQDVSAALDDLIFSYLTGGDEKS